MMHLKTNHSATDDFIGKFSVPYTRGKYASKYVYKVWIEYFVMTKVIEIEGLFREVENARRWSNLIFELC